MKHIKIYEEYTDDEIKSLIGDLHSVGHHKLEFDVKEHPDSKYPGWVEGEKEAAENWTSKYNNKVFLTKVSGEMSNLDSEDVDLRFSNGDKANFTVRHDSDSGDKVLLTLNGSEYDVSDRYKRISPFNKTIMGTFLDIYDIIK